MQNLHLIEKRNIFMQLATQGATMKIAFLKKVITPPVGTKTAGYGLDDVSCCKGDDLYFTLLALNDGKKKVVIASYDLIGIDKSYICRLRSGATAIFGGCETDFIMSCTHTHTGPNSRPLASMPSILEKEYMEELVEKTHNAVKELFQQEFTEVDVYFFSIHSDQNINRRYIGPENRCSFLPYRRDMEKIADGICDKEMGGLYFVNKATGQPAYVIGNYAAHPLAGHAPGIGGRRLSADFPGVFREYIEKETGAGCMFLSGACGDMVPRGHELGSTASRIVGEKLAMDTIAAIIHASRNPKNFKLENETIQTGIEERLYKLRPRKLGNITPDCTDRVETALDVQLLSIGDVCLVGVPGEVLAELGLEIKWHSPFRKTFILYGSTAYFDYICHGNALVSGGYEGGCQLIDSRSGLKMVNAAIDGAYKLYEKTFPDVEMWPENQPSCLVSLVNK